MRKFDYQGNNLLGAHGRPQQGYGYQQQGYPQQGYPQQGYPQQGIDMNTVVSALNTNTRNIEGMNNKVVALEREVAELKNYVNNMRFNPSAVSNPNKDFRSQGSSYDYKDELMDYSSRRFGGTSSTNEVDEPVVEDTQDEETNVDEEVEDNVKVTIPKENPFKMKDTMKWQKLRFDNTVSFKKVAGVVCDSLVGLDHDLILDGYSTNNYVADVIIMNDYVSIDCEFIEKELMVPPEALHLTMRRLMTNTEDTNQFLYLNGLDQLLTRKLNEYLELNVAKVSIPSFVNDYEELCYIIRERIGVEAYNKFILGFSNLISLTVEKAFKAYNDSISDELKGVPVPLFDRVTAIRIDTLSKFLGLDIVNFSYDNFTRVIVGDDKTSELFNLIITKCEDMGNEDGLFYLITKEDIVFKIVMTEDKKLYMKRFLTNFN